MRLDGFLLSIVARCYIFFVQFGAYNNKCFLTLKCAHLMLFYMLTNVLLSSQRRSRLYAFVASRWLRLKNEFEDKALAVEFSRAVERVDESATHLLLGSSTIARMPNAACNLPFVNLGVESLCTHHMVASISKLKEHAFDAVFLYVGVNDMIVGASPSSVATNLAVIVSTLRARRWVAMPIIESPYQIALGAARLVYLRQINVEMRNALGSRVEWITPQFATDEFSMDMLHLNDRGYARLLANLCKVLSE